MKTYIPTGYLSLDKLIDGFTPGQLIVIGGRPSMGKTAFVLGIAKNVFKSSLRKVLYYSVEMSSKELKNRFVAMFDKEMIDTKNLLIYDSPNVTVEDMRKDCEKFQVSNGNAVIVIDYLQLLKPSGAEKTNPEKQTAMFIKELKKLAKEFQCPVVVLSQLNRTLESRSDRRPDLSDLLFWNSLETDADLVIFIYRDKVYDEQSLKKNQAEILVKKNQPGKIGVAFLNWNESRMVFED